jgi:hypothetical protein
MYYIYIIIDAVLSWWTPTAKKKGFRSSSKRCCSAKPWSDSTCASFDEGRVSSNGGKMGTLDISIH